MLLQGVSGDGDDTTLYPSSGSSLSSPMIPKTVSACYNLHILLHPYKF